MKRRGRPPQISEEDELAIFDGLVVGEPVAQIAQRVGCHWRTVYNLRSLGRPRWRHRAHGNLEPSLAVIAWHCRQIRANWSKAEEAERRVMQPISYEFPEISELDLESLGHNPLCFDDSSV